MYKNRVNYSQYLQSVYYVIAHGLMRFLIVCKNFKKIFVLMMLVIIVTNINACAADIREKWTPLAKEDKLLYTNIGGALAITAWGLANWDYGERSAHADNEGWFGENTKTGGADKLGHMFSGYVVGRSLSSLYESWGYSQKNAAFLGAWSSFGILNFMEVGDSFSSQYGFSYEDFIMNGLGSYVGYVFETNPGLARKIDLRIEYKPSDDNGIDIFTDYENSKYLVALKLEGFSSVRNKYLKYLEIHLGYYTRGYDDINKKKERNIYYGVGLNLSRLFRKKSYKKTSTFLKYYQVPYTDIQHTHH